MSKKYAKNQPKKLFFLCDFLNKNVQILDHFFSLIFPQGFQISKHFGHPTLGSGDKNTFKRYLKVKKQTDGHTDTQTDKLTNRNHRPRGPMSSKQNIKFKKMVAIFD